MTGEIKSELYSLLEILSKNDGLEVVRTHGEMIQGILVDEDSRKELDKLGVPSEDISGGDKDAPPRHFSIEASVLRNKLGGYLTLSAALNGAPTLDIADDGQSVSHSKHAFRAFV